MYKSVITTSANPFHFGHLYLYQTAEKIFGKDNVLCLIAKNPNKNIDVSTIDYHMKPYNIHYNIIDNASVADYCYDNNIEFIIRGIRNGVDAQYELKIDFVNKQIHDNIQTIYIPTNDTFSNISSSIIRQLIQLNKFDIAKKYMNKDSFYRFIQGNYKYIAYYGKSCIGKSTFLKDKKSINVDNFMWDVAYKLKSEQIVDNHKNNLKMILNSNNSNQFKEYLKNELSGNKIFWTTFFSEIDNLNINILDWASIGNYWDYIGDYYKSQIKLVKIEVSNVNRIQYIMKRADERQCSIEEMSEHIKKLDNIYQEPPFFDQVIQK